MFDAIGLFLSSLLRCFRSRRSLLLENLALRQQIVVLKRKHSRPRIALFDKTFWILAHKFWSVWRQALLMVSPDPSSPGIEKVCVVLASHFQRPSERWVGSESQRKYVNSSPK